MYLEVEGRLSWVKCCSATVTLEAAFGFAMLEKEFESICGEWADGELREASVGSFTIGERSPGVVVGSIRLASICAGA